jgi:hypothetical protein
LLGNTKELQKLFFIINFTIDDSYPTRYILTLSATSNIWSITVRSKRVAAVFQKCIGGWLQKYGMEE